MGKQQKQLQKRKDREKAVQGKLRLRRESKRKKEKDERDEVKEQEPYNKMIRERIQLEQWAKTVEGKIPEELQDRIQHNIEILKTLEEEHVVEKKAQQEARELLQKQANQSVVKPQTDFDPEI